LFLDATFSRNLYLTLTKFTIMKRIVLLLLIAITISSCSTGDNPDRSFFLLPVESVTMPASYTVGNISQIMVKYRRPTQCHIFDGFYYKAEGNVRTVGIQVVKLNQTSCPSDTESLYEVPLDFKPLAAGDYTFKFWTGTDDNGVDQYIVYDVEVQ